MCGAKERVVQCMPAAADVTCQDVGGAKEHAFGYIIICDSGISCFFNVVA